MYPAVSPAPVVHRLRAAGPGGQTVHMVHPGALPVEVYRTLAAALPPGDGLTVLDLMGIPEYWRAGLDSGRADTTVEHLAERLCQELEAAHGGGPHTLAGWSFGGVVALAVSTRLAAAHRPQRLLLLDSVAPAACRRQDEALDPPLLLGWFARYLGARRARRLPVFRSRLAGLGTDDGLLLVLDAAVSCGALPRGTTLAGLRKLYLAYVEGLLRNHRLTAPHRPVPAGQPLVLVRAEDSLLPDEPALGWAELAPYGLEPHRCPGDHYTMLTRPDAAAAVARLARGAELSTAVRDRVG